MEDPYTAFLKRLDDLLLSEWRLVGLRALMSEMPTPGGLADGGEEGRGGPDASIVATVAESIRQWLEAVVRVEHSIETLKGGGERNPTPELVQRWEAWNRLRSRLDTPITENEEGIAALAQCLATSWMSWTRRFLDELAHRGMKPSPEALELIEMRNDEAVSAFGPLD